MILPNQLALFSYASLAIVSYTVSTNQVLTVNGSRSSRLDNLEEYHQNGVMTEQERVRGTRFPREDPQRAAADRSSLGRVCGRAH